MATTPFIISEGLVIDFIGVVVAAVSIIILFDFRNKAGEIASKTLNFAMFGIISQEVALIWSIVFRDLQLFKSPPIDMHHPLMVLGLVLFVVAAKNFPMPKNTSGV